MSMMELPKISIIIPVYNVETYIGDCLQSVMRQTYQGSLECILVDDCGTDNSIEVAEKLIAEYDGPIKFRVLHHERNRGLSAARNTAIDAAESDYVFFLDSDDIISDDCIETLSSPLHDNDYDMVVGGLKTFGSPSETIWLSWPLGTIAGNKEIFQICWAKRSLYMMACNKLIKLSLFRQYDLTFLEGQLHEDELWLYKCSLCMQSIYVCDQFTYYYRIREGSIMTEMSEMQIRRKSQSRLDTLKYVLAHPAEVERLDYDECVAVCLFKWLGITKLKGQEPRDDYVQLRSNTSYAPQWPDGVKHHLNRLHWYLPPSFGYVFLQLWKATRKSK